MTLDKASAALTALKVEEIPAEGQPFDPNLHNAVMQKPAEDGQKSGTVVQVFQKGYKIGDRIIRHATVGSIFTRSYQDTWKNKIKNYIGK